MTYLAAMYIAEIAGGNVPAADSVEAVAYREWSEQDAARSGFWAEFKHMEIQSEVRQGTR